MYDKNNKNIEEKIICIIKQYKDTSVVKQHKAYYRTSDRSNLPPYQNKAESGNYILKINHLSPSC